MREPPCGGFPWGTRQNWTLTPGKETLAKDVDMMPASMKRIVKPMLDVYIQNEEYGKIMAK